MAVLGILLLLVAAGVAAFGLWVALASAASVATVTAFGNSLAISPLTMFVLGAATVLLAVLALWLMTAAGRRKMRSRKERRGLEKQQRMQQRDLGTTRPRAGEDAAARSTRPTGSTSSLDL